MPVSVPSGVFVAWFLIGPRIKQFADEHGIATMPEFFEKRYNSQALKFFSSVVIFIFFIPYSAAVFMGLSYLFRSNFGLDYTVALVFMGVFTSIYLVLGGYKSMTMTDVMFGMIMIASVIILLVSTVARAGGISEITAGLNYVDPKLTAAVGPPGLWPLISLVFLTSIAPFAMPQLVQKFYAIRDKKAIKIGMIASTAFAALVTGTAYFIGATTRFFLTPEKNPAAFAGGQPDFDALMPELLSNVIPEALSILMLLLILSASMSTLAPLVLISSSSIVKDLYAGFLDKGISDRKLTLFMRTSSGLFVLLSVALAYFRPATIVGILGISWGAIGAVFLGPFIWGLFSKKVNEAGALCSAVLGLATCLTLYIMQTPSPQAGTLGMIVSLTANPLFSAIFSGKVKTT